MTAPRKKAPARWPSGPTLPIKGRAYRRDELPAADGPPGTTRLHALTSDDDKVYRVAAGIDGPSCDCPDWRYRRAGSRTPCKHIAALAELGLLEPLPEELP